MGLAVKVVDGGLEVTQVEPRYPAAEAGIELGDVLKSLNTIPLKSKEDLKDQMKKFADGDHVTLEFSRGGEAKSVGFNLVKR